MAEYKYLASIYDPTLFLFLRPIRAKIVEVVKHINPKSLIDICCGTGNQLKVLRQNGISNTVGIDISPAMLKKATRGKNKINCYLQDATQTTFSDGNFDLGIITLALHEKPWEIAQKMLEEAVRITKQGYLIIVDYVFDHQTSSGAKAVINVIERIAGKEHYNHFRNYIHQGGMDVLTKDLKLINESFFHFGGVRLRIYKN